MYFFNEKMMSNHKLLDRCKQFGLSLIELLVAMVIGLFFMAGVIQAYISSVKVAAQVENTSRLNENGRYALDFMSRFIAVAGYIGVAQPNGDDPFDPTRANNGAGSNSDVLSISAHSVLQDDPLGSPPAFPPLSLDCAGANAPTGQPIVNTFVIIPSTATTPAALGCYSIIRNTNVPLSGSATNPMRLVEGVENLQLLYLDKNCNGTAGRFCYLSWDRVNQTRLKDIAAIKIAILVNSQPPNMTSNQTRVSDTFNSNQRYMLLDANPIVPADSFARQVFTTTVFLKSQPL